MCNVLGKSTNHRIQEQWSLPSKKLVNPVKIRLLCPKTSFKHQTPQGDICPSRIFLQNQRECLTHTHTHTHLGSPKRAKPRKDLMGLLTGEILPGSGWEKGFISSLPFFKLNLFFNWRKLAFQCCTGFCHTTTQINPSYTYITSLLSLSPLPPHPTPLSHHGVPGWAPCAIQHLLSYLCNTWRCTYVNLCNTWQCTYVNLCNTWRCTYVNLCNTWRCTYVYVTRDGVHTSIYVTRDGAHMSIYVTRDGVHTSIYVTRDGVYMSMPLSPSAPPSPSPAVSTSPFSTSVSLAHLPRFHVYALIHNICFSLSALLHSV